MRYIDSGSRHADDVVGRWLEREASGSISEFRMQSGYFSLDGLGPVANSLRGIATAGGIARIVVGSNGGDTLGSHVEELARLIGVPRAGASLGVVAFANALFHPKTLHLVRADGTQAAYVGSANVSGSAMSGLNIEAGILLDEHDGDPVPVIGNVAAAVDAWFSSSLGGIDLVTSLADVASLVATGVLAKVRPPRVTSTGAGSGAAGGRPSLNRLVTLPPVVAPATTGAAGAAAGANSAPHPSNALAGYPPNARFATGTSKPTAGVAAVSGTPLPGGAVGVVLRLSKDTTRAWSGKVGTANVTIPVDALEPIRFGFSSSGKPRAEFRLEARRLGAAGSMAITPVDTNVSLYGYGPNPTGHRDRRLLLPKAASERVATIAKQQGGALPAVNDYALLEFPAPSRPTFRMTVVDPTIPLYGNVLALVAAATQAGALLGPGGCWLPPGVSPTW